MATAAGSFGGNYAGISIRFDVTEASVNTANNTSSLSWSVYLYFTGSYRPYDYSGSSTWSASVAGVSVGSGSYNYDFSGFSDGQTIGLGSGTYTYTHASNGTGTPSIAVSTNAASPLGSASGSSSIATTDILRTPQAPAAPTISRPNTGTTITVTSAVASAATGSPTPPSITDYRYRYSTDNSSWLPTASASVTGATADGKFFKYTVANSAAVGDYVTVTGITPTGFNQTNQRIVARTSTTISISKTTTGLTYTSGGTAVITSGIAIGSDRTGDFGPSSPITVNNAQVYYFQTAAFNSEGWGLWSTSGVGYAVPSITSVTKNGTSATVTVAPASSNGGSAITSHTVEYSTDQSTWTGGQSISGAVGGSTTFANLPAGKTYYFRAYATNAIPVNSPYQYNLSTGGTASIFISAYGKRYQEVSITGATSGASTVFTSNGHGFSANDPVVITGVDPTSFNISGTITSVTTNTFTVGTSSTGTYGSGGTASGWATILTGKRYAADDGTGNPGWVNITSSQKYTAGAWTSFN